MQICFQKVKIGDLPFLFTIFVKKPITISAKHFHLLSLKIMKKNLERLFIIIN